MKIQVNMTSTDIKQAIIEYLAKQGLSVQPGNVTISKNTDDERAGYPTEYYATVTVDSLRPTTKPVTYRSFDGKDPPLSTVQE